MLYKIHTQQLLKSDRKTVWDFISDPGNLAVITPEHMVFTVIGKTERSMYPGQIIEYYIKPLLGIKMHWVTEISHVKEGEYFVDEQRFGPYSFWHHQHFIKEVDGGIIMEDTVHYKIPFGGLGKLANVLFVKKQLESIFSFRYNKLEELFNKK